jgi:osmoprotectant transport system permease protein
MSWDWLDRNWDTVLSRLGEHAQITFAALALGMLIAFPVGLAAFHWRRTYGPILVVTEVLYTIPSLALFVLLINVFGLGRTSVVVGLAVYSLVILIRNLVEGLRAVAPEVSGAATAMGYGDLGRLLAVELPLATPAVVAGLRAAAVSTISLVSVGALIGVGGLGQLFVDGFQVNNTIEIWTGIVAIVLFALVVDALILAAGRVLSPWTREARA